MKNLSIALFGIAAILFTGCVKEGPAGPAGADGADAGFEVYEVKVTTLMWDEFYAEIDVPIITESIYNGGMVMVYVKDEFNHWNQIPGEWTNITGFAFFWSTDEGGILALDHNQDGDSVEEDYDIRVVTMELRDYELLDEEDLVSFESLTTALGR